ncbi:beta-xylosidase [Streptomyces sp. NPDC089799]|uniref:beta-xylosidase n=1 Tax=Streptomyces sp. NPDC089799 TaxID=3155066 RepID=UPI0034451BD3
MRRRNWAGAATGMAVLAAASGAMGTAAADGPAAGAPPGRVEFRTQCLPPQEAGQPPADGPTTAVVAVDNPEPRVGDTVTVTYRVTGTPAVNPLPDALPADVLTPTGTFRLAGAQTGEVTVTGIRRNDPAPPGGTLGTFLMTGTFTVTAQGETTLTPAGYSLGDTACTPAGPVPPAARLTAAPAPTANLRYVALDAARGRPGDRVKVTAGGFTPGARVTVAGRAGTEITADRVRATADDRGFLTADLAVGDRATTAVVAWEGLAWTAAKGSGPAAYGVVEAVPLPPAARRITATVEPGGLSMTQSGEDIALGAVPYGEGGGAAGKIGTVTVKDARGGPAGWSLVGRVTDFSGPGGHGIPSASLGWTPSCATAPGSTSTCAPGSPGTVGPDGAVLASTPDGEAVGGTFTVDAGVTLQVPPYAPPGAYTATLTLTLS